MAVVLALGLWQAAVMVFGIEKWLLPSPLDIAREAYAIAPRLWSHTLSTVSICLPGFAIGVTCGVLIAIPMHLFKLFKASLAGLLIITQNVPIIVLAPLLVVWFGFGLLPKMIVITLVCFFPVAVAMMNGLAAADASMKNYMRMIGASRGQLLFKLELPSALPFLFAGFKISATYSVMGAVISEWLGASRGLGHFMVLSSSAYRTDRVFAAIIIVAALSIVFYVLISAAERMIIRWRTKQEEALQ